MERASGWTRATRMSMRPTRSSCWCRYPISRPGLIALPGACCPSIRISRKETSHSTSYLDRTRWVGSGPARMNLLLVASRAVHFASTMLLFGELVFALAVAHPLWPKPSRLDFAHDRQVVRRLLSVCSWSLVVSAVSAALWLAVEASTMRGVSLVQALNADTLGVVLSKTVFGRLWVWRFGFVLALASTLVALGQAARPRAKTGLALASVVLAAVYLGSLAWAGHSAAGTGTERIVQVSLDIVHLLAGGGWLGALPALVAYARPSAPLDTTARIMQRFSTLGLLCVGAIACSGVANAFYLVGSIPALVGTGYGRLLLAKVPAFVAMLTLAAVNRLSLTPKLKRHDDVALMRLR